MNQNQASSLLALCFSIFVLVALLTYKAFSPSETTKYEYYIFSPKDGSFDVEMNREGEKGWQISSCRRATSSVDGAAYECIMQRQKGLFQ